MMTIAPDATPVLYVDADGHVLEPVDGMLEFAPRRYRDRIFHVERDDAGVEWTVFDRSVRASATAELSLDARRRIAGANAVDLYGLTL